MLDEETEIMISNDKAITFKDICMIQFKKVTMLANTEFRGGFYNVIYDKNGKPTEQYIPDTREVFNNSVYSLALLLIPKFDNKMKEAFTKFREKNRENKKKFIDESSIDEEVVLGEAFYENIKDKILLETYKEKKLLIYQYLFKELSKLLARQNYFEFTGGTYE